MNLRFASLIALVFIFSISLAHGATPELPNDYSPDTCLAMKAKISHRDAPTTILGGAPVDTELRKVPLVYDMYPCESLDAIYRWQPVRGQILSSVNAIPHPGSNFATPATLQALKSSLATLSSAAHRIETDYKKPTTYPIDPLGNYLNWSQKLFAERGWAVPKSLPAVFDELAERISKPYVGPTEQQAVLLMAGERGNALLTLATDVTTLVMTDQADYVGHATMAAQQKAIADQVADANTHFGGVKRRASHFDGFGSLLFGSAAMTALALLFFGRRTIATRRGMVIAFVAGTVALFLATLLGSGVHILTGIPGWIGWLLVLFVFGIIYVLFRDKLNARFPGVASLATHGSAAWATLQDAINSSRLFNRGMVSADSYGFALGRFPNAPPNLDPRLRYMGHVLTCAPNGSGKGIGTVIPTLLEYPGSALVLDIKGENYAVTARARRAMGHAVFVVDPFGVTGAESSRFNPLAALDLSSPDLVGQVSALVDMLVVVSGEQSGNEAHFNESAKEIIKGLIVYVAGLRDPARRTLAEVRRVLTLPPSVPKDSGRESFMDHISDMGEDPNAAFGVPFRAANGYLGKATTPEGSGVLSTAQRHTAFLDDPRIAAALSSSDFSFDDLKRQPMTVYVVMPPATLAAQARFIRVLVGSALSAITAIAGAPQFNVLFLLDEFAQLGRMEAVENAISLVRGYGARFWIVIQGLEQLKGVYSKWQTFMANSAKQFFGTSDYETAKYISDMIGQTTIEFRTVGDSASNSMQGGSSGTTTSQQLTARSLLTPDEVMRYGKTRPIVLIQGERPYSLELMNYLVDAEYAGQFDANPFHR